MLDPAQLVVAGGCCMAVGVGAFFSAFFRLKLRRQLENTPRVKIRSAAMGPGELQGTALPQAQPLSAPFSGAACCWWKATVEEERLVYTRNGERHEWVQVYAGLSDAPFVLDDGTGKVTVLPAGAEVDVPRLLDHVNGGLGLFGSDGLPGLLQGPEVAAWSGRSQRMRFREWRIDSGLPVFGLGVLRPLNPGTEDALAVALSKGLQGEPFLLSTESQAELDRDLGRSVALRLGGGLALLLLGIGLVYQGLR
jgi:hypothetical protein